MNTLIQLLKACESLLCTVEEKFWADQIKQILNKSEKGLDLYLLEKILSWYGGMGSLNDLLISQYNGHVLNDEAEIKLNDELSRIRSTIYEEVLRLIQENE